MVFKRYGGYLSRAFIKGSVVFLFMGLKAATNQSDELRACGPLLPG
jgi:hypothetical protein